MIEPEPPEWTKRYYEALRETDQEKLTTKIAAAECALFLHIQQMHHDRAHAQEVAALYDAFQTLKQRHAGTRQIVR